MHTATGRITALNDDLQSVWTDYELGFEELAEDLTDNNLEAKRRRVQAVLESATFHLKAWNAELAALHEEVVGWSG